MKIIFSVLLIFVFTKSTFSQDVDSTDLMFLLDSEKSNKPIPVIATFKTTRIINGHSIEQVAGGILDVKISHRFGRLNEGAYNLFGLDYAYIRIGMDYGITNWLMVGLGRSSYEKMYDGFFKIKLQQQEENGNLLSVGILSSIMVNTLKLTDTNRPNNNSDRLYYAFQLLVANKLSENLSLQITPSLVHYNLVAKEEDPNDVIAIGVGARQKITKWVSFNLEYYFQIPKFKLPNTENVLSAGFDIETGGHVFQLFCSNSTGIPEKNFISGTTGKWYKGDVYFGFNIARVFTLTQEGRKTKWE